MTETERLALLMERDPKRTMRTEEIVEEEIREFQKSEAYKLMVEAEAYYRNRSDVQNKRNDIAQRSNTRIEHALLKKLVDQKASYAFSKPFTVKTENEAYGQALNTLFDQGFRRKVQSLGKGAVKSGIAWLQPYFDDAGAMRFMRIPSTEVVPLWEDAEKERLGGFIRFYTQVVYEGRQKGRRMLAELWTKQGVQRFVGETSQAGSTAGSLGLKPDESYGSEANGYTEPHFTHRGMGYNFDEVPIVWLRYNEEELPLYYFVKELVDDINWQTSVTADVLRDIAKFIYVLRNYGGADLAEFIKDLQEHLAIKVDADGGVDKLAADLNIDAVLAFMDKTHKDAVFYANGVDTRDPELGNASGTAILFRYMDLDNDCQQLAAGMQDTFLRLKYFIDLWMQAVGKGDFTGEDFTVVFNMDMPVNETDVITNVVASRGLLSEKSLLESHPWVEDAEAELEQIAREKEENMKRFGDGLFDDDLAVVQGGQLRRVPPQQEMG